MSVSDFKTMPVQLAGQSKKIAPTLEGAVKALTRQGYYFELKFDGVRCLALVEDGVVTLINRRGADITFRYPEIKRGLEETFAGRSIVLDGELIVIGANGQPDFAGIHRRDAQARPIASIIQAHPATFMAFDCLHFEDEDIRSWPYKGRMGLTRVEAGRSKSRFLNWSTAALDGEAMWKFVRENKLEGLIAKRHDGPYRGGDRHDWIKIKQAFQVSCAIVGYSAGKGSRAGGIGALELALIHPDGSIVRFGEVGTGFTQRELADLKARIDAGQLLVAEVEIAAVTKDGKPRFPSYRGLRQDKAPADCTFDQLEDVPVI